MQPIKHLKLNKETSVKELVRNMKEIGFSARKIGIASEILNKMMKDSKIFLGLAGALVPGGMKNIIIDMLEKKVDVLVTTGANLTHDLIEALGHNHYQGDEKADDIELNEKGIDRIYDVFMKNEVYQSLEDFFDKNWDFFKTATTIPEFLNKIGEKIEKKDSILRVCYERNIPIFCPALADSGIGLMIWGKKAKSKKELDIKIDAFEDLKEIIDLVWKSKKIGIIYLGGGVPKNYIQQALQFTKGADYGIQITTDREESGGSSGAKLKEGISWGKMNKNASFVNVPCDVTIALPLIWGSVL